LASDPTRKIPNTDHAEHALTETSIIAARMLVRTLAISSSGSTADQASIQLIGPRKSILPMSTPL
jgi:hypothetical protein